MTLAAMGNLKSLITMKLTASANAIGGDSVGWQLSSKGVSLAEQAVSKNLAVEVGNVTISKSQSSINNLIVCY